MAHPLPEHIAREGKSRNLTPQNVHFFPAFGRSGAVSTLSLKKNCSAHAVEMSTRGRFDRICGMRTRWLLYCSCEAKRIILSHASPCPLHFRKSRRNIFMLDTGWVIQGAYIVVLLALSLLPGVLGASNVKIKICRH